ncbi:class I SAM-dependent methyltransferase [Sulfurimonas sp. HSL3-7]|uniref:class I SAM-dependent methyltransferase n=1 Tax=Sulfonitrofixus jiaomeiensis TaxID=3131938 RepID=UPI0031F952DB
MSENDMYEDFADRYDWMNIHDPAREVFFKTLFKKNNVSDVLDCACGTGKDLIMFHSLGYSVIGSDLSNAMLRKAHENLKEASLDLPLINSDFRELEKHFKTQFDAVVCLTNSINEVLDESEVRRALESMKAILRPGGILVFDQGQSDATMKNPPRYDPVINNRDFSRLFVLEYSANVMQVKIFDFVHTEDKCEFNHTTVNVAIRLKDDWDRILSDVGFSDIHYLGDLDFAPYDKNTSRRLIVVAHK